MIAVISVLTLSCTLSIRAQINAEQVMNIGRNVLSMDDYMLSIQYFNQAIKAKPYMAEPYFYRALAKLQLEDYKGAEEDCSLSIERNKFRTESYRLRGFARQAQGRDSLAILDYDAGLRHNPRDKYMLYYKAVAQTDLKQYAQADSTFNLLLSMFPAFEEGHSARGRLHALEGDTVKALDELAKAIGKSATTVQPYLIRAEILSHLDRWEEALADMEGAIRLQPREPDLYLNRAFVRYNLDDFFGAMADYNYALELNPHNEAALFNRALLRYEVKDLDRSAADLRKVLQMSPDNFHARFNLGLVELERKNTKEALEAFTAIRHKYPRYHNVYYALAEAYRDAGDMRHAMAMVRQGDELVKQYVHNPDKNPLDRPAVQGKLSNTDTRRADDADVDENEVIDKFNRLVTVSATGQQELSYNEKIKGRVQDRDLNAEPAPGYCITFASAAATLDNAAPVYFRELDDINNRGWSASRIYLRSGSPGPANEDVAKSLFNLAESLQVKASVPDASAIDWLNLATARLSLKDYEAAIHAFDKALELSPQLATAYIGRAYARTAADPQKSILALADYDAALDTDPRLAFVWVNKGNLYYDAQDFTSAISCYSKALDIDPSLGNALYNRGLTYLRIGNRRLAFADLSKAGELGVVPSYNLLKRMK